MIPKSHRSQKVKSLVYQVESQFLRRCGIMSALNIFSYTKGLWNLLEVNLNNLNRNIPYIHHKIRDSISVSSMPGDMICWIEIHLVQKSIYYISFHWMGLSYEFCCLYPGFCSARKAFTKLMKALYLYWKVFVSGS